MSGFIGNFPFHSHDFDGLDIPCDSPEQRDFIRFEVGLWNLFANYGVDVATNIYQSTKWPDYIKDKALAREIAPEEVGVLIKHVSGLYGWKEGEE